LKIDHLDSFVPVSAWPGWFGPKH